MLVDLSFIPKNSTVAVAVSGGSDSMALLHYLFRAAENLGFNVLALNVEHGIRGKQSLDDSEFVARYCESNNIPLLSFRVDSPAFAERNKLSTEEAARALRYECFYSALKDGKCDFVATAHHLRDNAESVLFNLFRGTGVKGLSGIRDCGAIIRPFVRLKKEEIDEYVKQNGIPFVNDLTNFCDEYTRNYIRLNVLPEIKKIFPEAERSISRLSDIAKEQSEYLEEEARKLLNKTEFGATVSLPAHNALLRIAIIGAFKECGAEKDWEKIHVDDVLALSRKQTGKCADLPKGVTARREYNKIAFYKNGIPHRADAKIPRDFRAQSNNERLKELAFGEGEKIFGRFVLNAERVPATVDVKSGFYIDAGKLPEGAKIRTRRNGDKFAKLGGGTKKLNDYFTDKKIPQAERDELPLIAKGNEIYAIYGVAVSEKVKADETTERLIKITKEHKEGYEKL